MSNSGWAEALERRWSNLKWKAALWGYAAFPRLSAASLEIDAAGLVSAEIPSLFSRNLREIDPSLNDDLLSLYGRSEQTLSNHFTFLNQSRKFETGIDWECPEGAPWRRELHAFDFALDLALTYRISLEERYARHLRYLIADWIASNVPVLGTGWEPGTLARRARNWILAADLARADWERDPAFLRVLVESLALQYTYLFRHAGSTRFPAETLDQARALLLGGKFFSGSRGLKFRFRAFELVKHELESAHHSTGGAIPRRPDFELRVAAAVTDWLLFEGGSAEASFMKEKLQEILRTLEGMLLPDATLPRFGSAAGSSKDQLADVLALAAALFGEPTWKTVAGEFGILPYMLLGEDGKLRFERLPSKPWKAEDRLVPRAGCFRLGGADSSALVVCAQMPASPDDHVDTSSFELSIQGQRVIVDSGAYALEGESGDAYFPSALAHNLLLVDRLGPRFGNQNPEGPCLLNLEFGPNFAGVRMSSPGFSFLGLEHERAWLCLDGRCWLIIDRLKGHGSHSATSLLHFFPIFEIQLRDDRAIARSRALEVTVIPLGDAKVHLTVAQGDHNEFPGWYAPEFGVKYPAKVLALEWTRRELPRVAGYLLIPGRDAAFHPGPIDARAGTVSFEISGKTYCLQVTGNLGAAT